MQREVYKGILPNVFDKRDLEQHRKRYAGGYPEECARIGKEGIAVTDQKEIESGRGNAVIDLFKYYHGDEREYKGYNGCLLGDVIGIQLTRFFEDISCSKENDDRQDHITVPQKNMGNLYLIYDTGYRKHGR